MRSSNYLRKKRISRKSLRRDRKSLRRDRKSLRRGRKSLRRGLKSLRRGRKSLRRGRKMYGGSQWYSCPTTPPPSYEDMTEGMNFRCIQCDIMVPREGGVFDKNFGTGQFFCSKCWKNITGVSRTERCGGQRVCMIDEQISEQHKKMALELAEQMDACASGGAGAGARAGTGDGAGAGQRGRLTSDEMYDQVGPYTGAAGATGAGAAVNITHGTSGSIDEFWEPKAGGLPHYIYEPVQWDITQEEIGPQMGVWYRKRNGSFTSKSQYKEEENKKGKIQYGQLTRLEVFKQMKTDYNNVINEIKKPNGQDHDLTEKEDVVLKILNEKWKVIVKEAFEQDKLNPDWGKWRTVGPIQRMVYPHRKIGIIGWKYGPLICEICFSDRLIKNSPVWTQCDFFSGSHLECNSCWND